MILTPPGNRRRPSSTAIGLRPASRLSEPAFETILNASDAVVWLKDRTGRYLYTSRGYDQWVGLRPGIAIGKTDADLYGEAVAREFVKNDRSVLRLGKPLVREELLRRPDSTRTVISLKFPFRNSTGKIIGVCGIATDITAQKRVENALRESEERFRIFTDALTECSSVFLDVRGRIATWDSRAEKLRGHGADVIGKPYSSLFRPADIRRGLPGRLLSLARRKGSVDGEDWRRRADGSVFRVRYTVRPLRDAAGNLRGYVTLNRDVTEETRLHHAMELSRHLMNGEERERQRVSRELHDGLNQVLSLAKSRLLAATPRETEVLEGLQPVVQLLDTAINEVRRISRNLRPSLLDDLGLLPALRNLCDQMEASSGIRCRLRAGVLPSLSKSTEDAIYRVVQEATANVVRHARATRLEISLSRTRDGLEITVRDNGRGLPRRPAQGHGLTNMRERAELAGGRFVLRSRRNRGTTIAFHLPLPRHPSSTKEQS